MKFKTRELVGAALDWAVALAVCPESFLDSVNADGLPYWSEGWLRNGSPSTDWSQCGPLIESHRVALDVRPSGKWDANCNLNWTNCCDTPLIAACRAIVSAKLGDTVDVPDELI